MKRLFGVLFFVFIFSLGMCLGKARGEDMAIGKGKKVSFDYTLTVAGEIVDSSEIGGPFQYTHGEGEIIPGLEKGLEGLHVGDEKSIVVPPEEAYGLSDPSAFEEVPRSSLSADINLKQGMTLQASNPNGDVFTVRVAEIKGDTVTIDFNHPLAGKVLNFQVKIVSIN